MQPPTQHQHDYGYIALPRRMTFPRFFAPQRANQISPKCHSHFYGPTKMRNPTRHQASGGKISHTNLQAGLQSAVAISPPHALRSFTFILY